MSQKSFKPFVLPKASEAIASDDDVIEYWNLHETPNPLQSMGQANIVKGWSWISAGVIVANDHR